MKQVELVVVGRKVVGWSLVRDGDRGSGKKVREQAEGLVRALGHREETGSDTTTKRKSETGEREGAAGARAERVNGYKH